MKNLASNSLTLAPYAGLSYLVQSFKENLITLWRIVGREESTSPAHVHDMTVDIASRRSSYRL